MSNLRTGTYGNYYGSYYEQSVTLTTTQKNVNALYIYRYLSAKGWTLQAISGILGNIEHESAINPGRWQSENIGNLSGGYSLTQWTPASKYIDWCSSKGFTDPSEMDSALARIIYEVQFGGQYYTTADYPETFSEFTKSTESPYYLACAFAWNYERSWVVLYGTEEEKEALRQTRGSSAEKWFQFLSGEEPPTPTPTPVIRRRKKYNFVLYAKRRWLQQ